MYYEDYEEYYSNPSEADVIISEAKEKLGELLTEEVKQTMKQAKEAEYKLEKLQKEIREAEYRLGNLKLEHQREEKKWETIDQYHMPRKYIKQLVEAVAGDFVPGDTVYAIQSRFDRKDCPLCHGKKTVECTVADGPENISIQCPTCNGRGHLSDEVQYVGEFRVNSINVKLCFHDDHVSYWNHECLYLGSGDWATDPKNVFRTKEEAEKAIEERKVD